MKNTLMSVLLSFALLGLAGCATQQQETIDAPVDQDLQGQGAGETSGLGGQALGGINQDMLQKLRIYFPYDSSAIDDENRAIVEAHAANLVANPSLKATLEGHADERGSREYNLALGERRAQAAERMMRVLGVTGNRIKVVSYGEEKPVAMEHNESAWRLNRRVEIRY